MHDANHIAMLAIQLGNAVTWIRNQKTGFMELTSTQSDTICYILKSYKEKEITAMDLMENLQLSQSTVSGVIARLGNKGLISRKTSETDNRKSIIYPTKEGLDLEIILKQKAVETEDLLLSGMSEKDRNEFGRLLLHALNNIKTVREGKNLE